MPHPTLFESDVRETPALTELCNQLSATTTYRMPPPETDNQQPATPLCKLVAALSLWLLMTPGPTCAQDDDARYLNELRSRRFFSLAARYCHDELAIEKQSSRQTDLAMELSRTLVEHGKFLPTSEREVTIDEATLLGVELLRGGKPSWGRKS